jgi:class 3 adenylate cyclase
MWVGDVDRVVDEIEEFLTGARPRSDHDGVLATVVVAEIVEAARGAARHGDRRWVELVRDYRAAAGAAIERFRGRPIGERPDGTMACFDGPARALRCAGALREAAERLGLRLRCGVHTGELEMREDDIGGLALHVAVQIAASARPGQIVASAIVRDLVAGSGLRLRETGALPLDAGEPLRLLSLEEEPAAPSAQAANTSSDLARLSQREREVLGLVAEGLSNAAIAKRLRLSDHTVKRHVANILMKLDLPTRAAAAAIVGRPG